MEKEGETRAVHSYKEDLKTTSTDGVAAVKAQPDCIYNTNRGLACSCFLKRRQHPTEGVTYAEADCEGFMDVDPQSPALWGTFGDAGRDESVSSSMSECEEGGLVDFFFPKACLNELLS